MKKGRRASPVVKSPQWTGWGARGIAQGRRPGYEDFARQTSRGQRALRFSHQDVRSARREPSDRLPPIVSSIGVHIRDVSPIAHSINNYPVRKGSARVRTENVAIGKVLREVWHQTTCSKTSPGQTHRCGDDRNFGRRCDSARAPFAPLSDEIRLAAVGHARVYAGPTLQSRCPTTIGKCLSNYWRNPSADRHSVQPYLAKYY